MTESPDLNTAKVDVLDTVANWRAEGREIALATVVRTWGSSPRPVGSRPSTAPARWSARSLEVASKARSFTPPLRPSTTAKPKSWNLASVTSKPGKSGWPVAVRWKSSLNR